MFPFHFSCLILDFDLNFDFDFVILFLFWFCNRFVANFFLSTAAPATTPVPVPASGTCDGGGTVGRANVGRTWRKKHSGVP